jgi:transcription-repair coupling factor (superfamily II helicase)
LSRQPISNHIAHSPKIQKIAQQLSNGKTHLQISNLAGSALSFSVAAIVDKTPLPFLLVLDDKEEAAFLYNDLEQLLGA